MIAKTTVQIGVLVFSGLLRALFCFSNDNPFLHKEKNDAQRRMRWSREFPQVKKETKGARRRRVHNIRGGRENNVRYMTKKEIKKYGDAIIAMGGKISE